MSDPHVSVDYKLKKKSNNGIIYSLYWELGYLFAKIFKVLRITPNLTSIFSFLFFIASGYLYFKDSNIVASICFIMAILMDCTDGKLARMTNNQSIMGIWLDYNFDYLKPICIYPTIAFSIYFKSGDVYPIVAAFIAMQSTLIFAIIAQRWKMFDFGDEAKESYTSSSPLHKLLKQFYFIEGIEPLFALACAIIGRIDIYLYLWAAGITFAYLGSTFIFGSMIHKEDKKKA